MFNYIVVFIISCFFSFWVQTLTYYYYKWRKHPLITDHKSVIHYSSGVVGDGLLVPLINVFSVMTLRFIKVDLENLTAWAASIIGGLIITFIFHFGQQELQSTNWTMPKVGLWNLLGVYHALFMYTECVFLTFTLINIVGFGWENGLAQVLLSPLKYIVITLFLFAASFVYDYRNELKIQRVFLFPRRK